jgi:hypothetical protein
MFAGLQPGNALKYFAQRDDAKKQVIINGVLKPTFYLRRGLLSGQF